MKNILILLFVFILSIFNLSFSADESVTITTYYPSPYGSYREIRATRMAIGDTYINGSTYYWDTPTPSTIGTAADLVVEGDVGIGTTSPSTYGVSPNQHDAKLDVNGYAATNDVWLKNPVSGSARWASEGGDWPDGHYCIIQAKSQSCPTGFTAVNPVAGNEKESTAICGGPSSRWGPDVKRASVTDNKFRAWEWAFCCK